MRSGKGLIIAGSLLSIMLAVGSTAAARADTVSRSATSAAAHGVVRPDGYVPPPGTYHGCVDPEGEVGDLMEEDGYYYECVQLGAIYVWRMLASCPDAALNVKTARLSAVKAAC